MSRVLISGVVFAGTLTLAFANIASAQGIGSNCVPTQSQPCFTLTLLEANRGNMIVPPADVDLLDPNELGQTYACNVVTGDAVGLSTGPLIRDCGPPADLGNLKPYYGTKAASAPVVEAPVQIVNAPVPAPTIVQVPIPAGVAPAVFGPVLPASGLASGSLGLIGTALGAAALVGVIGAAIGGDEDTAVAATAGSGS